MHRAALTTAAHKRATLRDWLKALPLYPLPHHAISRIVLQATRSRNRRWKNALIRWFIRAYQVDLDEAIETDGTAYPDFNSFFTRALRPEARPLPQKPATIICPADGAISEIGCIDGVHLLQAKGRHYTVSELLGGDDTLAARFHGGHFATVYLAPRDYHRPGAGVRVPELGSVLALFHPVLADDTPDGRQMQSVISGDFAVSSRK